MFAVIIAGEFLNCVYPGSISSISIFVVYLLKSLRHILQNVVWIFFHQRSKCFILNILAANSYKGKQGTNSDFRYSFNEAAVVALINF